MPLYRQILAAQPDHSVVVLAVGPLRNLANLLKSRPDDTSPLDGQVLIAKKVKRLEVMGGSYPPTANAKEAEWNFKQDPESAALVCSTWPTPVLFNGEGGSTNSGRRVTYEMPEHNPLTMAYRLYPGVGFAGDRLSWDSVSALVAIRGAEPFYKVVSGGTNVTDSVTGINLWRSEVDRQHSYLVIKASKHEIETALEDMQTLGKEDPRTSSSTRTIMPMQECVKSLSREIATARSVAGRSPAKLDSVPACRRQKAFGHVIRRSMQCPASSASHDRITRLQ